MVKFDLNEMEKYLDARKVCKYFIPNADECPVLTKADIQKIKELIKKYKLQEVMKCFSPQVLHTKQRYVLEEECTKCNKDYPSLHSKTSLNKYLFKPDPYICEKCRKDSQEKAIKEREEWRDRQKYETIENTQNYCNNYLNPARSWNENLKTWEKWNLIYSPTSSIDWQLVKEYIKGMNYYDFLKTPYWKAISEKKRKECSFKCQLCNSSGKLATHHRTYEIHGEEHFNMRELIVLCEDCHGKHHNKEEPLITVESND